jgi:hypothetical protein
MFERLKRIVRTAADKASDKVLSRIEKIVGMDTKPAVEPILAHGMAVPEPMTVVTPPVDPVVVAPVPPEAPIQNVAPPPVVQSPPPPVVQSPPPPVVQSPADVTKPVAPKVTVPKPVRVVVAKPVVEKEKRVCLTCSDLFDVMDAKHRYCRSCAREYSIRKMEQEQSASVKSVSNQEDEQIRAKLIVQYQSGDLPKDVDVRKNGAQVVLIAPVTRHGITVRRSFTYVDEKVAKQIAEERLARARAAESHRPKSPEQIRRERLAAAKAEAEATRKAADAAKAKAAELEKMSEAANLLSESQPSDDTIAAAITAFEATTQATVEADALELRALAAEQKLGELTAPVETAPKKSKKKGKKGEDTDGKKNGKNGRSNRHAN